MDPTRFTPPAELLQDQGAPARLGRRLNSATEPETVRAAAEDFEAMFLAQMMQHMFAGIPTDGPFGGGPAEEMYRALLVDEYGKVMARSGGIGIADMLQREILKSQEIE